MTQAIYKVTSLELWEQSQGQEYLKLSSGDQDFIHFAEEDDIARIAHKFFAGQPLVMVLEINPQRLPGRLVKECNPGGSREYYHLYEGGIPLTAIVKSQRYVNQ